MIKWKRALRTASSERFLAFRDGKEVGVVDIHYVEGGTVSGTVTLFEEADWSEDEIPDLLSALDEDYLPTVDLADGDLTYTVVIGRVVGSYEATDEERG